MMTAIHRRRARATRGAFMSGLPLLLATLAVLVGIVTPTAAQSLTRGPVMIETHHTDLAGNVRLSTKEAGDVTQRLDDPPFGEVNGRSCTGDGDRARSPKFQGTLRDPKTCLDEFGARDYDMVTGRLRQPGRGLKAKDKPTRANLPNRLTRRNTDTPVNLFNKGHQATRYVHPETGQSVVLDNVTREVTHVGGPGFKYF